MLNTWPARAAAVPLRLLDVVPTSVMNRFGRCQVPLLPDSGRVAPRHCRRMPAGGEDSDRVRLGVRLDQLGELAEDAVINDRIDYRPRLLGRLGSTITGSAGIPLKLVLISEAFSYFRKAIGRARVLIPGVCFFCHRRRLPARRRGTSGRSF